MSQVLSFSQVVQAVKDAASGTATGVNAPVVTPAPAASPVPIPQPPIAQVSPGLYVGTIRQFVTAGLSYKGFKLDIVALSTLCRIGMFQPVGMAQITKGRASAVYVIDTNAMPDFQVPAQT